MNAGRICPIKRSVKAECIFHDDLTRVSLCQRDLTGITFFNEEKNFGSGKTQKVAAQLSSCSRVKV